MSESEQEIRDNQFGWCPVLSIASIEKGGECEPCIGNTCTWWIGLGPGRYGCWPAVMVKVLHGELPDLNEGLIRLGVFLGQIGADLQRKGGPE